MSRKDDLENNIQESNYLLHQYEEIDRLSNDPKEQRRAQRNREGQRSLIREYLNEYEAMLTETRQVSTQDIREIAASVGRPLAKALTLPVDDFSERLGKTLVAPLSSSSASPTSASVRPGNVHVLLIGIGSYAQMPPLAKAPTDARDLHDFLVQATPNMRYARLLVDGASTKGAISNAMDDLSQCARREDTALIFFSGHGMQRLGGFEPGDYLCPVEADIHSLKSSAISSQEFATALSAIRVRRLVVFLDACHAGVFGEPLNSASWTRPGLSETAYAQMAVGHGRVVIASCQPDEVSWEISTMRNSLFTHYLIEGLAGAAADQDRSVRVFNLFEYLTLHVPKHMPQHPLFKGELDSNFQIVSRSQVDAAQ